MISIGKGNTIVEFFSAEIVFRVCKKHKLFYKFKNIGNAMKADFNEPANIEVVMQLANHLWPRTLLEEHD